MKTGKLDVALYFALAIGIGGMISHIAPSAPEPQPTPADPPRAETSVLVNPPAASTPPPPQPEPTATSSNNNDEADSSPPEAPALVWHTNQQAAYAESLDASKPLLIVFTMPHDQCRPCKVFEEQTLQERQVIESLSRFVLLKVPESEAAAWNVTKFPRVAIVRDGKPVSLWEPTADPQDFIKRLENP